ncbi:DAK2 domain-containing protein [Streptomyces noursei]|nr:DAK2 domain-containing protein [Streptomyces noursei]
MTAALHAALELVAANEAELGRLDAVAGDGDHGIGIVRGLRAAAAAARAAEPGPDGDPRSAGTALLAAGWRRPTPRAARPARCTAPCSPRPAPFSSGPRRAPDGRRCSPTRRTPPSGPSANSAAPRWGEDPPGRPGPVPPGAARRAADGLPTAWRTAAWRTAAEAATRAAADTARLIPTRGRAARMGVRGHGHLDAGAVSLALLLTAIGGTLR